MSQPAKIDFLLQPEDSLLLQCALVPVASRGQRETPIENIDWDRLFQKAVRHGLAPLLNDYLQKEEIRVPDSVVNQDFKAHCRKVALRSLSLTGELFRVLDLLEKHDIMAVSLKGPVLAEVLYGHVAGRNFGDLDILVRQEDASRSIGLLKGLGYRPAVELQPAQEQALLQSSYSEYALQKGASTIEIHWRIVRQVIPVPSPLVRWQDRLTKISLGGKEVWTLESEVMLWSLLAHGAMHRWKMLRWVAEVGRLVYLYPRMPWQKMLREAEESRSERILFWGLALADRLFVLGIPGELTERFHADVTVRRLVRKAINSLSCEQPSQEKGIQGYLAYADLLALQPALSCRLRLALQIVFSPNLGEWSLIQLPAGMSFLYYPLRPIRLLVRVPCVLLLDFWRAVRHLKLSVLLRA